jgi:OOP family OmpA-OmpF porin
MLVNLKAVFATSALALSLGACAGHEANLAQGPTSLNAYHDQLAANYGIVAGYSEDASNRNPSASIFNKKGMTALNGKMVSPEDPKNWGISSKAQLSQLQSSRAELIASLNAGAAEKFPADAARATASYDCWVAQTKEGWQQSNNVDCQENFLRAMSAVDKGMVKPAAAVYTPIAAKTPAEPTAAQQPPAEPAQYMLFFEWNSAKLTDDARKIIKTASENSASVGVPSFELVGYTDSSGSSDYNQRLSIRRADAVADYLSKLGVSKNDIRVSGRGELEPLAPTADGVREPQNRRVHVAVIDRRAGT